MTEAPYSSLRHCLKQAKNLHYLNAIFGAHGQDCVEWLLRPGRCGTYLAEYAAGEAVVTAGLPESGTAVATKVLVVDDEESLLNLVRGYLEREGFAVDVAGDGEAALTQARELKPDLVVLDVMLPGLDGVEVCRRLRQFSDAYVIMLTARSEEIDKIVGLSVGADDYLTKPFSPRELVARVKAMLRRPRGPAGQTETEEQRPLQFGSLALDLAGHRIYKAESEIILTPLEYKILTALASAPGRVFTREQLLEKVWGYDYYGDDHVVDVHVATLRKKLEDDPARPRWIATVRGAGYRFEPAGGTA